MKTLFSQMPGILCCWFIQVLIGCTYASSLYGQALSPTSLEVTVQQTPALINAIGRHHIVYELHLTNWGMDSLAIRALSVYDSANSTKPLSSLSEKEVAHRFYTPTGSLKSIQQQTYLMPPGSSGLLYQWVTVPVSSLLPKTLIHRFSLESEAGKETLSVNVPLESKSETVLNTGLPVFEGDWVTVRGPSNSSGHRRSFHVHNGLPRASERFAVDWVKLSSGGKFYEGDPSQNENWHSYDQPVRSVTAGVVVHVKDGLPDQAPLSLMRIQQTFDLETVSGNTIVIEIEEGQYAVYAHLKSGSIRVDKGEKVQAGEVIGHIGNSGHSLAPHLHFHVEDQPLPLTGNGVPFNLHAFELIGKMDSVPQALRGGAWVPDSRRPSRPISEETPLENMVIRIFK